MARAHTVSFASFMPAGKEKTRTAPKAPAQSPSGPRVSWIPGQIPTTEEEQILHDALTQQGLETLGEVKAHLAYTLYWRDFLRGGWATDIGLLRSLYSREAQDIIDRLNGLRLRIEESSDD